MDNKQIDIYHGDDFRPASPVAQCTGIQLSLRPIGELLFELGGIVTYETFVTLRGEPYLLWRAVDERGAELDILLQERRDTAAARRFFKRVLRSNPAPTKMVTD